MTPVSDDRLSWIAGYMRGLAVRFAEHSGSEEVADICRDCADISLELQAFRAERTRQMQEGE